MMDIMTMAINNRCAHLLAFGWFEANIATKYLQVFRHAIKLPFETVQGTSSIFEKNRRKFCFVRVIFCLLKQF